jgi:hypothetical protein
MDKVYKLKSWANSTHSMHIQTFDELNQISLMYYKKLNSDELKLLLNVIDRTSVPKHYSFILKDKEKLIKKVEKLLNEIN